MKRDDLQYWKDLRTILFSIFLIVRVLETSFAQDNHEYVDLGLPSGTLWATCNIGANSPEEYGDYFAWGETQPKDIYFWSTYQYCNGSSLTMTKYCSHSSQGYNGFTDNMTDLLPEDDAATANWGNVWRMPTPEEWYELKTNTTSVLTTQNGVKGWLFTASNGNTLFLPAAGYRNANTIYQNANLALYWSCSQHQTIYYFIGEQSNQAIMYNHYDPANNGSQSIETMLRYRGLSVRPVRSSEAPTGAIKGKFSVSDVHEVYFSQGNLQYQASTDTWQFAKHQWDYIGTQNPYYGPPGGTVNGSDNVNISPTYSGWIDLFGWGTSGWNNGNTYYQPWNTQNNGNNTTGYGYGPTNGVNYNCSLTNDYSSSDWGVYNIISNGGNQSNRWRTLTVMEWQYLLYYRTTSTDARFAMAKVNNVDGLILLPDNWQTDTYLLNDTNNSNANFSSNVITLTNWINILEHDGAVFLPAAGFRDGSLIEWVKVMGRYWSSSCCDSDKAFELRIADAYVGTDNSYRFLGYSVRLVSPVQSIITYNIEAVPNPAEGGIVTGAGTYDEGQTCTITATANEGYSFANWTENDEVVSTDTTYIFTVTGDRNLVANFEEIIINHDYVDLGLPSGTLWATCNVGANSPEEYGDYFAWGETQPKTDYDWSTYQYCNGNANTLTKYCNKSEYGYNGYTDDLNTLLLEDDAANVNWGSDWHIPSKADWEELIINTNASWMTINGIRGVLLTASNGNNIFLPAAGYRYDSSIDAGSFGLYLSNTLYTYEPVKMWEFYFHYSDFYYLDSDGRFYGQSVRAVRSAQPQQTTQTLSLSSGTNWVSFNVAITLDDLKAALVAAAPNGTAISVKSHTQTTQYNPNNHRWTGQLNSLDMTKMYRITVDSDCQITMTGTPIDANEYPVTISSGVNWIAFPLNTSMSVRNAFQGFVENGDMIKSQTQNIQYKNGRWQGQLNTLEPGKGYKYQSAESNDRTFTFPSNSQK